MTQVFLVVPTIFLLFVAPIWVVMHYLAKMRANKTISTDEEEKLYMLWDTSRKMEERLIVLEKILSENDPKWRENSHE